MPDTLNYERDMTINPKALDVEWLGQASLFMRYSEKLAHARDAMDRLKEKLDVTRAELDNEIRTNAGHRYFPESVKVTNPAVEAAILQHEKYQRANDGFLSQKLEVELLSAAVRSLDQRKSALENLVKLYGQGYFAGPKEPRDLSLEFQKRAREGREERAYGTMAERNQEERPMRRR